jgi:hypothetical protein
VWGKDRTILSILLGELTRRSVHDGRAASKLETAMDAYSDQSFVHSRHSSRLGISFWQAMVVFCCCAGGIDHNQDHLFSRSLAIRRWRRKTADSLYNLRRFHAANTAPYRCFSAVSTHVKVCALAGTIPVRVPREDCETVLVFRGARRGTSTSRGPKR